MYGVHIMALQADSNAALLCTATPYVISHGHLPLRPDVSHIVDDREGGGWGWL